MLRDTSAASTSSRSTSSPASAVLGTRTTPARISVSRILITRIAAPRRPSPAKTAKTRPREVYAIFGPGLIRDDAARRERDLNECTGVERAFDAEIGAIGLGQRLGQR